MRNNRGKENYCVKLENKLNELGFEKQLEDLQTIPKDAWSLNNEDQTNELDHLLNKNMKCSEGGYRSSIPNPPWSMAYDESSRVVCYFNLIKKKIEGHKITNSELEWHMQKLNIPFLIIPTAKQLQILRNRVKRDLKNIKAQAADLQEIYLLKLLASHELKNDEKKIRALKAIIYHERMRRFYAKLSNIFSRKEKRDLSIISTEDDDGEIVLLMCRDKIHDVIIERNKATLSQCKESPMYQGSLAKILHPEKWHHNLAYILNDPTFIDTLCREKAIRDIFSHLQSMALNPMDAEVTIDDIKSTIRWTPEKIASSHSGRHYGHHHAMLCNKRLLKSIVSFYQLQQKHGFAFRHWHQLED